MGFLYKDVAKENCPAAVQHLQTEWGARLSEALAVLDTYLH